MTERSIFAAALDIADPADRAAYLDRACAGDVGLRRHVEELLAAQSGLGSFLNRPAAVPDRTAAYEAKVEEGPGSRVGPYKLLQEIGEGGMGTVFMAEQEEPVRRMVAVKIIRAGMDSKGVLARFEAERQALALMDHPNIARVLDAGTTDTGSPYFVMELVKGVPITKFCDENQLSLRERLELFIPVCQAIQHAHMKGIIHRDVKPSNVLVAMYDDKPVPKVIDFGVAKATSQKLTDKTLFTAFGAVVGTLEYMSPEQAKLNQLDIDTRSDVYALGVLLYELLTGSTPLDRVRLKSAALDEVLRLIREEEPPKPSTRLSTAATLPQIAAARGSAAGQLGKVVRGELDWIVMKALEKDRTRRYDTASNFAADVQRYLTGEQVQAVPPSLGYRMRKAYRRNRVAVWVATAFVCLALGAAVMGAVLAVRATDAEMLAAENARQESVRRSEAETARADAERQWRRADQERDEKLGALNRAERLLYVSQITQAHTAALGLRTTLLTKLLADASPVPGRPDPRGWEWHYLDRLAHSWDAEVPLDLKAVPGLEERVKTRGSGGEYNYFQFTSDGSQLLVPPLRRAANKATGSSPGAVGAMEAVGAVFDTATGKVLRVIPIPTPEPLEASDVTFSPDGLFMGFPDRSPAGTYQARVIELATGKDVPLPFPPTTFLPRILVTAGAKRVVMYDESTPLRSTNGQIAVAAGPLRVWDRGTDNPKELVVQTPDHASGGERVDVLPTGDGAIVAILRTPRSRLSTREVEFWDLAADRPVRRAITPIPEAGAGDMAFSPNGQFLAITTGTRAVGTYEVSTGKKVFDWNAREEVGDPETEPRLLASRTPRLSDGGSRLLFLERDNVLRVVERRAGNGPPSRSSRVSTTRTSFLRDAAATGQLAGDSTGAVWFAADGKRLLKAGAGVVRTWDLSTAREFAPPVPQSLRVNGTSCQLHPTANSRLAIAYHSSLGSVGGVLGGEWPVAIYDTATARIRNQFTVPDGVAHAELSKDGNRLLLATRPSNAVGEEPTPPTWSLRSLDEAAGNPEVVRFTGPPAFKGRWFWTDLPAFTTDGLSLIEPLVERPAGARTAKSPSQSDSVSHVGGFNLRRSADGVVLRKVRYPAAERVHERPVSDPDGTRLVVLTSSPSSSTLYCYDTIDGKQLWYQTLSDPTSTGPVAPLPTNATCRVFPDGAQVAVAWESSDGAVRVRVMDMKSGVEARTLHALAERSVNWSAPTVPLRLALGSGGSVAVSDYRDVFVWDALSPNHTHRLVGHIGQVVRLLFSADGRRLFTNDNGTNSLSDRTLRVWDVASGRELLSFPLSGSRSPPMARSLLIGTNLTQELWVEGDRMYARTSDGIRVFDGTPRPEPKK